MVLEHVCFADGTILLRGNLTSVKEKPCTHCPEDCGNGEEQQQSIRWEQVFLEALWFFKLNTAFPIMFNISW